MHKNPQPGDINNDDNRIIIQYNKVIHVILYFYYFITLNFLRVHENPQFDHINNDDNKIII